MKAYYAEGISKYAKISTEARHDIAGALARLHKFRTSVKDYYLKIVAVCEAAVAGAGLGVALIGAMEIATAITAQPWLAEAKQYMDYAPLVGGAAGAIVGRLKIARRSRAAAAKMIGVSDPVVLRVRANRKSSDEAIPLSTPAQVSR